MKRYALRCPSCDEETVVFPSSEPDKPYCTGCSEDVDLDDLQNFIASWTEYLQDRTALLEKEKKDEHNN